MHVIGMDRAVDRQLPAEVADDIPEILIIVQAANLAGLTTTS